MSVLLTSEAAPSHDSVIDPLPAEDSCCFSCLSGFLSDLQQFYAVWAKDTTLQWRQWKANVCQLLTPIVCLTFMFILQVIVTDAIGDATGTDGGTSFEIPAQNLNYVPVSYLEAQLVSFALQNVDSLNIPNFTFPISIPEGPGDLILSHVDGLSINETSGLGQSLLALDGSTFPFLPTDQLIFLNETSEEIDNLLLERMVLAQRNSTLKFPYLGAIKLSGNLSDIQNHISYVANFDKNEVLGGSLSISSLSDLSNIDFSSFSSFGFCQALAFIVGNKACALISSVFEMDLVHSAIINAVLGQKAINELINNLTLTENITFVLTRVAEMPFEIPAQSIDLNVGDILGPFVYPLILLLPLPTLLFLFVSEKETKQKELMLLMGLREKNYFFGTFFSKLIWIFLIFFTFYIFGLFFSYRFFTQTDFLIVWFMFFLDGCLLISLSFFLSSIISSSFVASILGYLIVLFAPIVGLLLNQFVLVKGEYDYKPLLLLPPLPLTDSIYRLTTECTFMACGNLSNIWENYDFLISEAFIIFQIFVFFFLGYYLEKVIPQAWGRRRHPLFCISCLWKKKKNKSNKIKPVVNLNVQNSTDASGAPLVRLTTSRKASEDLSSQEIDDLVRSHLLHNDQVLLTVNFERNRTRMSIEEFEQLEGSVEEEIDEDEDGTTTVRLNYYGSMTEDDIDRICEPYLRKYSDVCIVLSINECTTDSVIEEEEQEEEEEDEDVVRERQLVMSGDGEKNNHGIVVRNLVKTYGWGWQRKVQAVRGISFRIRKKECFGLLGPNGAGKTTVANVLSGMIPQTDGTAFINGFDISEDMGSVRRGLGVCPQFSIYDKSLTCLEHILFYCRLKGVPMKEEKAHAEAILEKVGLDSKTLNSDKEEPKDNENKFVSVLKNIWRFFFPKARRAGQLSGGMRRRLSIAIALTGNPSTVLLDEPTTGLDPKLKRDIWDIILEEKRHRSVVLTTHSMAEAEALSDRIGIMAHGKLMCIGDSLHLKRKFGKGYGLTVRFAKEGEERRLRETSTTASDSSLQIEDCDTKEEEEEDTIVVEEDESEIPTSLEVTTRDAFLRELSSCALVTNSEVLGDKLLLELHPIDEDRPLQLSAVFEILQNFSGFIIDFEINQTSLEDVFVNIVEREEKEFQEKEDAEEAEANKGKSNRKKKSSIAASPDIGLEEERIPIVESGSSLNSYGEEDHVAVGSVGVTVQSESIDDTPSEHKVPTLCRRIGMTFLSSSLQTLFLLLKNYILAVRGWTATLSQLLSPAFVVLLLVILALVYEGLGSGQDGLTHPPFEPTPSRMPRCTDWNNQGCRTIAFTLNGLGKDPHTSGALIWESLRTLFERSGLIQDRDTVEFETQKEMEAYLLKYPNRTSLAVSFPKGTLGFDASSLTQLIDTTSLLALLNISLPGNLTLPSSFPNITLPLFFQPVTYSMFYNASLMDFPLIFKPLFDNILYEKLRLRAGVPTNLDRPLIEVFQQAFPIPADVTARNGQLVILTATGPLFFSLSAMVLFVISVYQIVGEKEAGLRAGMQMLGMQGCAYVSSWVLYLVTIALIMALVTIVSGLAFQVDAFLYSNVFILFLMFFVFDLSLITAALALSAFVTKARTALVMGFIVMAITFIINVFLSNGPVVFFLYSLTGGYAAIPALFQVFYSPFNFAKGFLDVVRRTVKVYDSAHNVYLPPPVRYGWDQFTEPTSFWIPFVGSYVSPPSSDSLLYMLLNCLIYFISYIILDWILYQPQLFVNSLNLKKTFSSLLDLIRKGSKRMPFIGSSLEPKSDGELNRLETDVREEYDKTRDAYIPSALRVANYEKTYRSCTGRTVRAARGVDFCVPTGEITGLLGHNGAGKSTILNGVAGLIVPTSGDVIVDDRFSIRNAEDRGLIALSMGVCPQHDFYWPELTAREHVWLLSLIKGKSVGKTLEIARQALSEVALTKWSRHRVKEFSGGMRRRLSVAMSFVSNPRVVMMDEPTTGVDVVSRRSLWHVIQEKRDLSSMLLTTHSMEEADLLASKIVILSHGRVIACGDSLHLKEQYGAGYVLQFVVTEARIPEFDLLMEETFPNAEKTAENAGVVMYSIGTEHYDELITGLRIVEERMEMEKRSEKGQQVLIREFGLSRDSLLDIYLRITGADERPNDESGDGGKGCCRCCNKIK